MRSALDQMDPDNEPLIQDAGSADGTQEIVAELARARSVGQAGRCGQRRADAGGVYGAIPVDAGK
jgi:hypothetical protein